MGRSGSDEAYVVAELRPGCATSLTCGDAGVGSVGARLGYAELGLAPVSPADLSEAGAGCGSRVRAPSQPITSVIFRTLNDRDSVDLHHAVLLGGHSHRQRKALWRAVEPIDSRMRSRLAGIV